MGAGGPLRPSTRRGSPPASRSGRLLQTARLPEVTLVVHLAQNPDPLGLVQERNDAQVAAQKIGQPPQRGSLA
jgi:hypothetical protein